jgi:hypothetical protein
MIVIGHWNSVLKEKISFFFFFHQLETTTASNICQLCFDILTGKINAPVSLIFRFIRKKQTLCCILLDMSFCHMIHKHLYIYKKTIFVSYFPHIMQTGMRFRSILCRKSFDFWQYNPQKVSSFPRISQPNQSEIL